MFYVYILQSLRDKGFYVGMSTSLAGRLAYHNSGRVSSTKRRRPLDLVYFEEFTSRNEARKREKYLKSYGGSREKLEIFELLGKR